MKNQICASIVIPVYNTKHTFLKDALLSVARQKGMPANKYEVIVVNDHSTREFFKGYKKVIEKIKIAYPNLSMHLISNMHGKCPGNARNTGIKISKGEFVGFLDADDAITTNCLLTTCEAMKKEKNAMLVFSDHAKFDSRLKNKEYTRKKEKIFKLHKKYKNTLNDPLLHTFFPGHFTLVKKTALNKVKGYNCLPVGEDFNLALKISHISKEINFVYIPKVLYKYRSSATNITNKLKRINQTMIVERMLYNFLIKKKYNISEVRYFGRIKPSYSSFYNLYDKKIYILLIINLFN